MIQSSTLSFLKKLKSNNNKAWFDANRNLYNDARSNIEELAAELIGQIGKFDSTIAHLKPKDCLFRINRDVRFSANKAPYKTNMSIYLSAKGKQAMDAAGYYLHLEPGASFIAGGLWMPMAPELKKVRQEIDYNFKDWQKIAEGKKFKETFGSLDRSEGNALSRPPKGYDADNPAIEYLKLKSFIASRKLTDQDLTQPEAVKKIAADFKVLHPLIQWLNEAMAEVQP
jgi:uncharacterized protein (TIGR02453 family)